jgi:hypothetical protein
MVVDAKPVAANSNPRPNPPQPRGPAGGRRRK